jgi:hypothetical protein
MSGARVAARIDKPPRTRSNASQRHLFYLLPPFLKKKKYSMSVLLWPTLFNHAKPRCPLHSPTRPPARLLPRNGLPPHLRRVRTRFYCSAPFTRLFFFNRFVFREYSVVQDIYLPEREGGEIIIHPKYTMFGLSICDGVLPLSPDLSHCVRLQSSSSQSQERTVHGGHLLWLTRLFLTEGDTSLMEN